MATKSKDKKKCPAKLKKKKPKGTRLRIATMQDRCTNVQNLKKLSKMITATGKFLKKVADSKNQSKKLIVRKGNSYIRLQNKGKKTKKGSTSTTAKRKRTTKAAKAKTKATKAKTKAKPKETTSTTSTTQTE